MVSFVSRGFHEIVVVEDTQGYDRKVCKCQLKDKHFFDGRVEFPVYECPWLTRKHGYGTENGI